MKNTLKEMIEGLKECGITVYCEYHDDEVYFYYYDHDDHIIVLGSIKEGEN